MRKKLLKGLGVATLAFFAVGMTSCSLEEIVSEYADDFVDTEDTTTEAKDDDTDETTKGDDSDDDETTTEDIEFNSKLKELGDSQGFEIKYEIYETDSESTDQEVANSFTVGQRGNSGWYILNDGEGMGYTILSETQVSIYDYSPDEGWAFDGTYEDESANTFQDLIVANVAYLEISDSYNGFTVAGKKTIAGRACTKYSATVVLYNFSFTVNVYVDDEYQIALKVDTQGNDYLASYTVTDFTVGVDVPFANVSTDVTETE